MRWAMLCWLLLALPAAARKPPVPLARTDTPAPSQPQEAPEDRLARARQSFLNNDFPATVQTLRGLVYPEVLLHSEEDVRAVHRMLALSYYLSRNEDAAEREFTILLALRPDFALDPVLDPPQAIAFLERLRARQRQRLDEIERRRREEAAAAAREESGGRARPRTGGCARPRTGCGSR